MRYQAFLVALAAAMLSATLVTAAPVAMCQSGLKMHRDGTFDFNGKRFASVQKLEPEFTHFHKAHPKCGLKVFEDQGMGTDAVKHLLWLFQRAGYANVGLVLRVGA